jgi:hypothetical protein
VSALKARTRLLEEGVTGGRERPRICPGIPAAVSADPDTARIVAAWWIRFYLTRMGPLYRHTLSELRFGTAVEATPRRYRRLPGCSSTS